MQNFSYSTQLNGQPNYDIGIDIGSQLAQAQNAFNSTVNSGGLMASANAPAATANTQQVQDDQLMSNQITDLLGSDSRYIGDARQRAIEQAAGRGMGNSSFAAGAAERAAIQAAAPIAQFDASRFGAVANMNQNALNQAELANASNATQLQNTMLSGSIQNRNQLQQMLLGHQFGAMDDVRRQMFGLEDREDRQAFDAGQFAANLAEQQRQFDMNLYDARERFAADLGLRYDQLSQQDQQYVDSLAFNYAQLQEQGRQADNSVYANLAGNYFGQQAALMGNPSLDASQIPELLNNFRNSFSGGLPAGLLPPWMQNYQPSSVSPQGWSAAGALPPFGAPPGAGTPSQIGSGINPGGFDFEGYRRATQRQSQGG